jgi:transcription elongation factor GreB
MPPQQFKRLLDVGGDGLDFVTHGGSLSFIPALESRALPSHIHGMSKAFTKENDEAPEDDGPDDAPALPAGQPNYITPAGLKRLQDELQNLLRVERPKTVEVVSWAAGNGDRSENGDYLYGKKRLREIDRRIRCVDEADLARGEVSWISPIARALLKARVGDTVELRTPSGPTTLEIMRIEYPS